MRKIFLIIAAAFALTSCGPDISNYTPVSNGSGDEGGGTANPSGTVKICFIHHRHGALAAMVQRHKNAVRIFKQHEL